MLVVLESTTYPGTTHARLLAPKHSRGKFTLGENVFLAFSPERVDPGNTTWFTKNTPKVLGSVERAVARGRARALRDHPRHRGARLERHEGVAEMVKLLEDTFRCAVNTSAS